MPKLNGQETPKNKNKKPSHSNIINIFALTLAAMAILSFLAVVLLRYKNPTADVGTFLNTYHTALGYIAGIITANFGHNDKQKRR